MRQTYRCPSFSMTILVCKDILDDHSQIQRAREREPTANDDQPWWSEQQEEEIRRKKKSKSIKQVEWTQSEPFCLFIFFFSALSQQQQQQKRKGRMKTSCSSPSLSRARFFRFFSKTSSRSRFSYVTPQVPTWFSMGELRKWARIIPQLFVSVLRWEIAVANTNDRIEQASKQTNERSGHLSVLNLNLSPPAREPFGIEYKLPSVLDFNSLAISSLSLIRATFAASSTWIFVLI